MNIYVEMTWVALTTRTGCTASCKVSSFTLSMCRESEITWKANWSSAFYLAPADTEVIREIIFSL